MNKKTGRAFGGFLAACMLIASPAMATEPLNNNAIFTGSPHRGDHSTYGILDVNATVQFAAFESISPSGDVDYQVISCQNDAAPKVKKIELSFTHAQGDIDMCVYTLAGTLIGCSTGTTNNEIVDLSGVNWKTVVLKVYGYAGATNPRYDIQFWC
jgi:hypothetical protein